MTSPDRDAAQVRCELAHVRNRVDELLQRFLADERAQVAQEHRGFLPLLDEVGRLISAGGKRLRPAFCYWGYRSAGGQEAEGIWHVAGALELFHTFALIHDDLMDRSESRRGVPTIHVRMAEERVGDPGAGQFGLSAAILAGDFTMVLADHLFLQADFPPERLAAAFRRYNRMRVEVAMGQFLDISGSGLEIEEADARRISSLKSGSYTVEGPLHVGAILAGAPLEVMSALARYGAPLGEAFQIRDDLEGALHGTLDPLQAKPTVLLAKARRLASDDDRRFLEDHLGRGMLSEADHRRALGVLRTSGAIDAAVELVNELIDRAVSALDADLLEEDAVRALRALATLLLVPAP